MEERTGSGAGSEEIAWICIPPDGRGTRPRRRRRRTLSASRRPLGLLHAVLALITSPAATGPSLLPPSVAVSKTHCVPFFFKANVP